MRHSGLEPMRSVRPVFLEGFADEGVVLGFEELQERSLKAAFSHALGDVDLSAGHGVDASVVHARGDVEGAGDEILDLVGTLAASLQVESHVDHGVQIAARVTGDEVGDEVLLFAGVL